MWFLHFSLSLSLSDEAGFDHKAHNIVFLKHPALQEATSSVTALCCRKHMKYKHKRMFFFSPGQWSKISRALTRLPHSKNEMQHQSKTDPPKAELLAMIFTSDYLQLDLFKYAWWISKHECTHIKSFITKPKTLLWMLDYCAPALAISHTFQFCWMKNPRALFKNKLYRSFISP